MVKLFDFDGILKKESTVRWFGFFEFLEKKLVKMVKLFDFYGILWYFEKGLMGSLWVDLGHRWFFVKSIHCPLLGDSKKFPKFQIVWRWEIFENSEKYM